ncbi:predicted protein [Nematostella vectensis]|uniref:FHIP family protein v1g243165 n=1 Tax=Nematostella vectensis TaxID=45351 RepID=U518_NEMVE|nr:RecName: Full=FHIP family protein v1g243165 [Nematostella vectensis]EDO40782.1 predicted protein [Nematostella vectensis]|eukprot:XP_001632845.1 predicted protein [Nematostella vectensis]
MSLLKKLASLAPAHPSHGDVERREIAAPTLVGNAEYLKLVDVHWNSSQQIMGLDSKTVGPQERCKILMYHLNEIVSVLAEEKEECPGPCLKYVLDENIFEIVFMWGTSSYVNELMKREQIKVFRNLIERSKAPILIYEQVWKPLLCLLHSCASTKLPSDMEEDYVAVLKGLCVSANRDIVLLDLFFLENHNHSEISGFSVFSLLIPYVHREGDLGVWARDAMLLSMALSSIDARLGSYIVEETNFCPILAIGLSGLFSDLPTSLDIPSEDWYSLERGLWATFPELVAFLTSLEFCNNVIQIAHHKVQHMLLELIYHGFLVSVMSSALTQSSVEALTAVTAYLDLFVRSITDSKLMQVFVKFLLVEKSDGVPILDSLVARIGQESQLAVVSLGLIHTLLDLNCEDILYTLVLKYLIPCTHILSSQRRTVREVDYYSKSAAKFLSLIPSCCHGLSTCLASSRPESPSCLSSTESLNKSIEVKIDMKTSHDFVKYRPQPHVHGGEATLADYLEYLADARQAIRNCQLRCSCWSMQYDGTDLSSTDDATENNPANKRRSLVLANGSIPRSASEVSSTLAVKASDKTKRSLSSNDLCLPSAEEGLGPFLSTLFRKLENMAQNTFYVNLILTAVITRLCYYPQPLLKSFLLNYNIVLKPGVRSLFQILSSIKIKVENVVESVEGLHKLLRRARNNLILREEKSKASIQSVVADVPIPTRESIASPTTQKRLARQKTDTFLAVRIRDGPPPSLMRAHSIGSIGSASTSSSLSLTDSIESLGNLSPQFGSTADISEDASPVSQAPETTGRPRASAVVRESQTQLKRNTFRRKNPKAVKNAVYCIVMLEEWLKELAAISQEHALLPLVPQEMQDV